MWVWMGGCSYMRSQSSWALSMSSMMACSLRLNLGSNLTSSSKTSTLSRPRSSTWWTDDTNTRSTLFSLLLLTIVLGSLNYNMHRKILTRNPDLRFQFLGFSLSLWVMMFYMNTWFSTRVRMVLVVLLEGFLYLWFCLCSSHWFEAVCTT